MSLSELNDFSWAKTVFQISPVGDAMSTTVRHTTVRILEEHQKRKSLSSSGLRTANVRGTASLVDQGLRL